MKEIIWHKHHIVPRHAGGTDDPSNLLKCNIAMHAFMHSNLYEEYGRWEDNVAALSLRKQLTNAEANRMAIIESNKARWKDEEFRKRVAPKLSTMKGKKHSKETKFKIKQWSSDNGNPMTGKNAEDYMSDEAIKLKRANQSKAALNRKHSEETKLKMSAARKKYWEDKRNDIV